jgi:hypothetical protein
MEFSKNIPLFEIRAQTYRHFVKADLQNGLFVSAYLLSGRSDRLTSHFRIAEVPIRLDNPMPRKKALF